MRQRVFLSHNSADKPFVRRLATDLKQSGADIWLDEWEIQVGDSLIQRIADGIDGSAFLVAVISENSAQAPWVVEELSLAMTDQIGGSGIKVLPVRIDDSRMPHFLRSRLYADFRVPGSYYTSLNALLISMGFVGGAHASAKDVRWYCTYCGWGCTEDYNDYICRSCHAVRVVPIGSATMQGCRRCGNWDLLISSYCSRCGVRFTSAKN